MHSIYNVPHVLYTWTGISGDREVESFLNEANVMKHLSAQKCEYIVQLVGVQVEQAPAMIAMELAPGGNLLDILKSSWMMVSATHTLIIGCKVHLLEHYACYSLYRTKKRIVSSLMLMRTISLWKG